MLLKKRKIYSLLLISILIFYFFSLKDIVFASNEPYKIDITNTTPPSFDDYEIIPVTSLDDLNGLSDTTKTKVIYELQNDITMTSSIQINGDKAINLNFHTLSATSSGNLIIGQNSSTNNFKLYNGSIIGGPESKTAGNWSNNDTNSEKLSFFYINYHKKTNVVFEDMTYNSPDNGGNFFNGLASNIFSLGTVNIKTFGTNIRAGNMTFLGDFNGTAFGTGIQNQYGQGNGGLNLTFGGIGYSFINKFNRPGGYSGNEEMTQTNGDRRIYIGKDSHVVLKNTNDSTGGNLLYCNNIGNFSTITIDGSLDATSIGTSLRTTAAQQSNPKQDYDNQAGTYNGQANINVNEGAKFKIASTSTNTSATYGTLYTYNTNIYAYKTDLFDMRYFSTGNFFYSYSVQPYSNMYLYDQNIGVWDKSSKGLGNPINIWQNVDWMSLLSFQNTAAASRNVSSSNPEINPNTFTINNYSRISSDVALPMIMPDSKFIDNDDKVFLNNGATSFNGSTDYYLPEGKKTGEPVVNGEITFTLDGKTYTKQTDSEGKWTFDNLDLTKVKGGTIGTLELTDHDHRYSPKIEVIIKDTIPPTATPKLMKVALGNSDGLSNPKLGVDTFSDETTDSSKIKFEFITSIEDRNKMINKVGVYSVDIKVSDEAGNSTIVTSPVIVHLPNENITDGFVVGNDFEIDFNTWINASTEQKRVFLTESNYGDVQGYSISGNIVTNVTKDPSKMIVTIPNSKWEPEGHYPITVKVNSYTKIINVKLIPSTVKMTIKQVYKNDHNQFIYNNLEKKTLVKKEGMTFDEEMNANISNIINNIKNENNSELEIDYDWYEHLNEKDNFRNDYMVIIDGKEVDTDKVPDKDFELLLLYTGITKLEVSDLDYGKIPISKNNNEIYDNPNKKQNVTVTNTDLSYNWKLTVSLKNNKIQNITNDDVYLGGLLVKKNNTPNFITDQEYTISKQAEQSNKLLSIIPMDIKLYQNTGNSLGNYKGNLLWSLQDSPIP